MTTTTVAHPKEMFHRGETSVAALKAGDPHNFLDPIFKNREDNIRAEVATQVAVSRGMDAFGKDSEGAAFFYQELARFKVISRALATKLIEGKAAPSVKSKFSKIRQYADQLLDPRVLQYLGSTGYSVLYELAQLFDALEGKGKPDPVSDVSKILEEQDGPISRSRLEEETQKVTGKIKAKAQVDPVAAPAKADPEKIEVEPPQDAKDDPVAEGTSLPDREEQAEFLERIEATLDLDPAVNSVLPVESDEPDDTVSIEEPPEPRIHILLATPTSRDVVRIRKGEMPPQLSSIKRDLADQAILILHTKLATLISMVAAGVSEGFDRSSTIFMTTQPAAPDVGDCDVLAVFERGEAKLSVNIDEWPSDKGPLKLANRILKDIDGRRVHLFAKTTSTGWEGVNSDAMWAETVSAS